MSRMCPIRSSLAPRREMRWPAAAVGMLMLIHSAGMGI